MRRRIALMLVMIVLFAGMMPAGIWAASPELPELGEPVIYHTPADDYIGGDCVLTSCKMMLRRYAITRGSFKWSTITNADLRPHAAPSGGMKYEVEYLNDGIKYHIVHGYFKGSTKKTKLKELRALLLEHPEGVIVWGGAATRSGGPHAVLAIDVTSDNDIVAGEPAYNVGSYNKGVLRWGKTIMGDFNKCTKYWYIESASGTPTSAAKGTAASTIAIYSVRAPSEITEGDPFTIRGSIESNYRITRVVVSVVDSDGKTAISKSARPDSWMYEVHDLDSKVKFGTLAPGRYTYKIRAKDEKLSGYKVLYKTGFKVLKDKSKTAQDSGQDKESGQNSQTDSSGKSSTNTSQTDSSGKSSTNTSQTDSSGKSSDNTGGKTGQSTDNKSKTQKKAPSSLAIKGQNVPGSLMEGESFSLKGRITSDHKIKSVIVSVLNADGDAVLKKTVKPAGKKYDLSKIGSSLKFTSLRAGSYTYRVRAVDTAQKLRLVNSSFSVVRKAARTTLRIRGASKPEKIRKGNGFAVKGTITSEVKIRKVTVTITNAKGRNVISRTAKPGKTVYKLSKMDKKIRFGELAKGKYIYRVTAEDTESSKVLINKSFTVY